MLAGKGVGMLREFYQAAVGEDVSGSFDTAQLMGNSVQVTLTYDVDSAGVPRKFASVSRVTPVQIYFRR